MLEPPLFRTRLSSSTRSRPGLFTDAGHPQLVEAGDARVGLQLDQPEADKGPRRTFLLAFVIEFVVVLAAVMAYFLVRGLTEGSEAEAIANAHRVADVERLLHVAWEAEIQGWIVGRPWLETAGNWVYIWGHWPFVTVVAVWLFRYHRSQYYLIRNAFLISGAIGLVVFVLFPVAPPRLAGMGLEDTVTLHSQAYRVLQPPAMVNQYAAMPSLHFGWNLLVGGAVILVCKTRPVRLMAACLTVAMLIAVVLTANHFVLDVIAGAAVALFGLAVSGHLRSLHVPDWIVGSDAGPAP